MNPFAGLPGWLAALFLAELLVIVASTGWVIVLFVRARRQRQRLPPAPERVPDELLWVFVVPALDEETTIADSVARLVGLDLQHRIVLVVDDGSTDRTPEILAAVDDPDLVVLRRDAPDARRGKAAALNAAWRHLASDVLAKGPYAGWRREDVVVSIVDADGRIGESSPRFVAAWITAYEQVGGVQTLVRIYNRRGFLTWCQNIEFSIYAHLFQLGRTAWGTAGMGGNGQFNRLSALDDVADVAGPWRDVLTEDQDLGLRLIEHGWHNVQEVRATVDQQGLGNLRRLYRQRTRWAQGNLQALARLGAAARSPVGATARCDLVFYLLGPLLQALIGIGFAASIVVWLLADVPLVPSTVLMMVFFYAIGFGGAIVGMLARSQTRSIGAIAWAVVLVQPYAVYSWLIFPVLVRATARLLAGRGSWAKTAREPIGAPGTHVIGSADPGIEAGSPGPRERP